MVRSNAKRGIKFLIAGVGGFLFFLVVLYTGIELFTTKYILSIDIASAFLSVMFGFTLNEHWSTKGAGQHAKGISRWTVRLFLFEGVYAFGNLVSIAIQLSLYYYLGVIPYLGSFIGTLVAFPLNYLISMKLVWRINILDPAN